MRITPKKILAGLPQMSFGAIINIEQASFANATACQGDCSIHLYRPRELWLRLRLKSAFRNIAEDRL